MLDSKRRSHCWIYWLHALLWLAMLPRSVHAAPPDLEVAVEIGEPAKDPKPVKIEPAVLFADKLTLHIDGLATGPSFQVDIYPQGLAYDERSKRICTLTGSASGSRSSIVIDRRDPGKLTPACRRVLRTQVAHVVEFTGVLINNSPVRIVLEFKDFGIGGGHEITEVSQVATVKNKLAAEKGDVELVYNEDVTDENSTWHRAPITDARLLPMLESALGSSKQISVYVHTRNPSFTQQVKISLVSPPIPVDPVVNDKLEGNGLKNVCEKLPSYADRTDGTHNQVCVDMTVPAAPRVVIMEVVDGKATQVSDGVLVAGRPIYVRVYHETDKTATIIIAGNNRFPRPYYIHPSVDPPAGEEVGAGLTDKPKPDKKFTYTEDRALSRAGPVVELDIKLFAITDEKKEKPLRQFPYAIRNLPTYRGAVRIGAALMWAPWDATYGLRGAGEANPGRELYVIDGGRPRGRFGAELTLGYSWYACWKGKGKKVGKQLRAVGVPENFSKPWFSWYLGVGVVSSFANSATILSSIHTGPEISFNHNWSMVFAVSVRRTRWLRQGYEPGDAFPATGDVPLTDPVYPTVQFGIIINFSPDALAIAGKVKDLGDEAGLQ